MKTNPFRQMAILLGAVTLWSAPLLHAASSPMWAATVPVPSFFTTSSQVISTLSRAPSSTLVVIGHYNTGMAAGIQLVLIGSHGQILATGELAPNSGTNVSVTPLSVTPRKVIVLVNSFGNKTLQQGTIDPAKHFVFTPLAFASVTEQMMELTGVGDFNDTTLFTNTRVSNLVMETRRYSLPKLKP